MALSPQKRQKKLEKQKAKRQAEKRALARRDSGSVAYRMGRCAAAPVLHSCVTDSLWIQGMGNVLFSRELPSGEVALAMFLVDAYCLGVKDAWGKIVSREEYNLGIYKRLGERDTLVDLTPEAARKLVEGAVAYARDLGFEPHSDYQAAQQIFGTLSTDGCTEEFTYGKDGKPYFIAGPHDTPWRCDEIIQTLLRRLGPGGFGIVIPLQGGASDLDPEPDFQFGPTFPAKDD